MKRRKMTQQKREEGRKRGGAVGKRNKSGEIKPKKGREEKLRDKERGGEREAVHA